VILTPPPVKNSSRAPALGQPHNKPNYTFM